MKVKNSMIDKDLRFTGIKEKILVNTITERKMKLMNMLSKMKKIKITDPRLKVEEQWITRKDGSKMRVCIFKSVNSVEENMPGVLWLHGGGYCLEVPEQSQIYASQLMQVRDCVVIVPEYRLATEAPYPAAFEDSYETLLWMKDNAKELGIRDNQLMVGGDSAGGGLTAALSLYARDKKEVAIAFQMPIYPMLDDKMTNESAVDNNAPVWNSKSNYNGWKVYLGDLFKTDNIPCYAAAARAKDYTNLPPTVTFVGDIEPFRDETIMYVENLKKAGVKVEMKIFKGCFHAFDQTCPEAEVSQRAFSFLKSSFKYASNNYYAEQYNK